MRLKGTSVIELTDARTGEKETYRDDNMVTLAVPKVLGVHIGFLEKDYSVVNAFSTMLPPVPNTIGGILCYEEALPEDATKLYAPIGHKLVGCVSNDANNTTSTTRGSMNLVESGPLEDGRGYRFVFDFSTSQGNGTIAALALTSKFGGISGAGDAVSPYTVLRSLGYASRPTSSNDYEPYIGVVTMLQWVVNVRYDHNDLIAIVPFATGELQIWSIPFPMTKVDLSGGIWNNSATYKVLATVTPSIDFWNGKSGQTQTTRFYGSFFDGGDGYWWGFSYRALYSTGTNTIYWVKINQETYQVEEGTWTLNNVTMLEDSHIAFADTLSTSYWYSGNYLRTYTRTACGGGYLYILNYTRDQVYKINLANPTDVTTIPIKKIPDINEYSHFRPIQTLRYVHGYVYTFTGFIDPDDVFTEATITWYDGYMPPVTQDDQVFCISCGKSDGTNRIHAFLHTPYLATVNNLDKPVQKTADKTMKITYILREE